MAFSVSFALFSNAILALLGSIPILTKLTKATSSTACSSWSFFAFFFFLRRSSPIIPSCTRRSSKFLTIFWTLLGLCSFKVSAFSFVLSWHNVAWLLLLPCRSFASPDSDAIESHSMAFSVSFALFSNAILALLGSIPILTKLTKATSSTACSSWSFFAFFFFLRRSSPISPSCTRRSSKFSTNFWTLLGLCSCFSYNSSEICKSLSAKRSNPTANSRLAFSLDSYPFSRGLSVSNCVTFTGSRPFWQRPYLCWILRSSDRFWRLSSSEAMIKAAVCISPCDLRKAAMASEALRPGITLSNCSTESSGDKLRRPCSNKFAWSSLSWLLRSLSGFWDMLLSHK